MHELHIGKRYLPQLCIFFQFTSSNPSLPCHESPESYQRCSSQLKKCLHFLNYLLPQSDGFLDGASKREEIMCSDTKRAAAF